MKKARSVLSDSELGYSGGDADESNGDDIAKSTIDDDGDGHVYASCTEKQSRGSNMVYCVILAAAVISGTATYIMLDASSERTYQTEFKSYARQISDVAGQNADKMFGQLRSLATSFTSSALDNSAGFPNVMVSHFDLRMAELANITGAEMFLFVPLVEQNNKAEWLVHAQDHKDWIAQDYASRGWDVSALNPISQEIQECTFCGNDTRRGFDNADGFMEAILEDLGYDSQNITAPISQYGPAPVDSSLALFDLFSHPVFKKEIVASLEYDVPVVSEASDLSFMLHHIQTDGRYSKDSLRSFTLDQVKETLSPDSKTVGYIVGVIPWEAVFANLLPVGVDGIFVVVESDCGSVFTYTPNGGMDANSEMGDRHYSNEEYENMAIRSRFFWKEHPKGQSRHCHFDLVIYPSDTFREAFRPTSDAPLYAGLVVLLFIFTALLFLFYDKYVEKKQEKVISQAKRAEAIVTSVFPKAVGLRLIQQAERDEANKVSSKMMLNNFLVDKTDSFHSSKRSKPIADLFPETTVMFADIVGFTAWSSMREPTQVFVLLESIYNDFDRLANKRKVFKVETVGDCYVAVCGLPQPRHDHAIVMSRFAAECVFKMAVQVQALEVELGPDTADLGIRVGLHSGPVTAGVLRGDRARFQLFGDTVNTCARIESTGRKNKIHLSKETADLLAAAGKSHWITPRSDKVSAKGKGELETFWLKNIKRGEGRKRIDSSDGSSSSDTVQSDCSIGNAIGRDPLQDAIERRLKASHDSKPDRLVKWNVDVMSTLLQQVAQQRHQAAIQPDSIDAIARLEQELTARPAARRRTALDEVVEIIELPRFDANTSDSTVTVSLSNGVLEQLQEYVKTIASMYNENSFHNFEHASHVTMSVRKLLGRIVAPDDINADDARERHDHTYGITSDPLTQFAVILSALLHDVDHSGVPNSQLVSEGLDIARIYNNKSVAEQNSIDLAWSLLMLDRFKLLRQAIYSTEAELRRFRQLVVNTILATDIMDKELQLLRKVRWDKAFSDAAHVRPHDTVVETTNRKATIVIEHLIQASDIAHTMQHWHVYRKWNGRLFCEMYKAFKEGRSAKDPSEFWYEGEIGFFDFNIIPLAKKLEECGVFGVSSHEYLNYAEQNRREWEAKGRSVVQELIIEAEALSVR